MFGYEPREAVDRLEVAKRLAELPGVFAALRNGENSVPGSSLRSSAMVRVSRAEPSGALGFLGSPGGLAMPHNIRPTR